MFPIIQRFIKNKKIKDLWGMCFIVLVFQWGSCIPVIRFFGEDSPVYIWFMYCFPIFRIGDFFVGCTLGKQFAEIESHRLGFIQTSIIEVVMTLITIGVFAWLKIEQDNIFILALHNWTTIFIPIATIWTYLFAVNNGVVTRIFTNKVFLFIGNISAYTYLIHNVITRYTNTVFEFLNIGVPINIQWRVILIEFIITILFAILYIRLRGEKNGF